MRRVLAIVTAALCAFAPVSGWAQQAEPESLMDVLARATQQNEEQQRSGLISFVENQISTPDRQIRLTDIDGALSSQASIGQITIADTEGIWLIVENARITWNQGALIFGRLEIQELAADSIAYIRNPVTTETSAAPPPEAGGFAVPEFPVAVILESLSVPRISFGEQVFGLGSEISLAGAMTLADGAIDADLDMERLDGPGGSLNLDLVYSNQTREIDLDLNLVEPRDGIVANLLNIEGRPEIALGLAGEGPIDDLEIGLSLDADGNRVLEGNGTLAQGADGLTVAAQVGGPIADILPAAYKPFFGTRTELGFDVLVAEEGGVALRDLRLTGGQLSLSGTGRTGADGFLTRLDIEGEIAPGTEDRVILPIPGASTTLDRARFSIDFGDEGSDDWFGNLQILGLTTPEFSARSLALDASGVAANLEDPDARRVTFNADGMLEGIETASQEIAQALGSSIGLGIAGLWEAGEPVILAQFRVMGEALSLQLSGEIADAVFDGDIALQTSSLAPFSGLAGRDLSGAITLDADGTLSPLIGGFDLTLDGRAEQLSVSEPAADALLEGEVMLTGRIARTERGLETEDFFIGNDRVSLTADGTYASGAADFRFDLDLADLGLVNDEMSGALTASGTATGGEGRIALDIDAAVPNGSLSGRSLRQATIGFEGISEADTLAGTLSGSAFLDGFAINIGTEIDSDAERLRLSDIAFEAPGTTLTGNLTRFSSGLFDGRLILDAPNVETAAALALLDASGAVDAEIVLTADAERQQIAVDAAVTDLVVEQARIARADIGLAIEDAFGVPVIDGAIDGGGVAFGGVVAEAVQLRATSSEQTTQFDANASLQGDTDIVLSGALSPIDEGYSVRLETLGLSQGALRTALAAPSELTVAGDTVRFSGLELAIGSGRLTATGSAGDALDIAITISDLPLSIANTIAPDLDLSGTVSGSARISGSAADPRASFDVNGQGINASALAPIAIAPLSFSARGDYANNTVRLAAASAQGSGGLNATASGTIPLDGGSLDLTVNGNAPLSLANQFVAERGAQVSGNASANVQVTGPISDPRFSGTLNVSNGQYVDPQLALNIEGISGSAAISGTQVQISSLTGQLATGGSVSVTGSLGLDAPDFTSNITLSLNNARYADGNLVVATLNGRLVLSGPIGRGGQLSGNVDIARADITVPEAIGGPGTLIDVRHINTPASVLATLARLQTGTAGSEGGGRANVPLALDVTILAPNQVFIRGRGLDAEVGGQVRLTGNIANLQPVGGFELIRGRLSILGQRIDFDSGSVTLIGDLDPFVDLNARIAGNDITVIVRVTGRASEPEITFSSDPMLPQDEVLSRLIFNRGVGELSPLQIAQLAAAAAELAGGGGGGGLVNSLREAAGLDDLDIVTDEEGNAALRAGRYINDNIYLGVEAGAGGDSRVTIDLDITEGLTARGAASTNGDSSVGVFYEQDY